jgi:cytochrome c5
MRRPIILGFVALSLTLGRTAAAELTPKETADARKIYIAKCAKCHELYDPKAYADADWATWMKKMSRKSKLKPEQIALLVGYTETLRKPVSVPANP